MALVIPNQPAGSGDRRGVLLALVALLLTIALVPAIPTRVAAGAQSLLRLIVQETPGAGSGPEQVVRSLGGTVDRQLAIIGGFSAHLPADRLAALRSSRGVSSAIPDGSLTLLMDDHEPRSGGDVNSMDHVTSAIRAQDAWGDGWTGAGIDVALIDSGVAPVNGLTRPGKVINGPDLSFDSQDPELRYLDGYGHGTHMAGIIAGLDDASDGGPDALVPADSSGDGFTGVAPDARIVSVKVAASNGATDVSQVIAAIDWVVQHRDDNGMHIRVLNLSFGTSGTQDYLLDPLTHAVEVAWHRGIVVVVAGGNDGFGTVKLNDPAYDPFVIAVSAVDMKHTDTTSDDTIAAFSSTGDAVRHPDFGAPGVSIPSLRVPGSYLDTRWPGAVLNERFFKGSGTSQAAAVVSGAAALILQARPDLRPDQVKYLLAHSATPLDESDTLAEGAGEINVRKAIRTTVLPTYVQRFSHSTGTGSLEDARGLAHVAMDGITLQGEQDIFGKTWNGAVWAQKCLDGTSWNGGDWRGIAWTGVGWNGISWTGSSWTGSSWTGSSWTGSSWTGSSWTGSSWTGRMWSSAGWGPEP
jgi:subtilisin family serine protease